MFWPPKDVYDLSVPILLVWKYVGLPSYKIIKTPKATTIIQTKSILNYVLVFFIIGNTYFYEMIYRGIENNFEDYTRMYRILAASINYIATAYFSFKQKKQFIINIEKCYKLQKLLNKLGNQEYKYNRIALTLWTIYATKLTIMTISTVNHYIVMRSKSTVNTLTIDWYCSFFAEMFLFYFLMILKSLYVQLENHVKCTRYNTIDLIQIYKSLRTLCREVNKSFNEIMLLRYSTDFIFIAIGLSAVPIFFEERKTLSNYDVWTLTTHSCWIPMALGLGALAASYFEDITILVIKTTFLNY